MRHVYAEVPKKEFTYTDLSLSSAIGDHNFIKCNPKYFAVSVHQHGSLAVFNHGDYGKKTGQIAVIDGHKEPVLDFDFNPFYDNLIATGSTDATVKVWGIPDGGLTANLTEPLVDLHGHQRKIGAVKFHPTAEHVLATASADKTIKVWDVEVGECKVDVEACPDVINDMCWVGDDGSMLASSCRDKHVRLCDPRTGEITAKVEAHTGAKACKIVYLGLQNKLATCGFTRQSKRQFKLWDPRKFSKPIHSHDIDQASGVMMPFYDEDSHLLYIAGKGDGNIRFFEIVNEEPWSFEVDSFKSTTAAKGVCVMPRRAVDTSKKEVAHILKLTNNGTVEPLSFIVPRKSDLFQEDLFPPCQAGKPAHNAESFFSGKNKKPILMSMNPKDRKQEAGSSKTFTKPKTAADLTKELKVANARIKDLEEKLKKAGIKA